MTLGELLINGGWAMVPIYVCSAVALAIFAKKFLEFRAEKLRDLRWLDDVIDTIEEHHLDLAQQKATCVAHPAGRVVASMLSTHQSRPDRVPAEAQRTGSLELQRLEKNVGALSFIAQAAPLLGLLGTVIGMVELFMSLQGSGMSAVDATLLASGIWKALLTTAAGLIVAVPTLAAYSFLNSRTDHFRLLLRDSIERVITALPLDDGPDHPGSMIHTDSDKPLVPSRPQLVPKVDAI